LATKHFCILLRPIVDAITSNSGNRPSTQALARSVRINLANNRTMLRGSRIVAPVFINAARIASLIQGFA
jgi:hypothetical protein